MAEKTTDYKKFKVLKGNRVVDKVHVKSLARSIALNPELLAVRPILVNKNFEVIDGQHRLAAAKMVKVPVYYDVADLELEDTIIINHNQRNWLITDYAKSYADLGKQDYIKFLEMQQEYPWFSATGLMYYLHGVQRKKLGRDFREGKFEITDLALSRKFLDQLEELQEIEPRSALLRSASAWLTVFKNPNYDHKRMMNKMRLFGKDQYHPYGRVNDIMRSIEDTYNFKAQGEPIRIYGR